VPLLENTPQGFELELPIVSLPVKLEDLIEREAGCLGDPPVHLVERDGEPFGEKGADRALSSSPHSHEGDDGGLGPVRPNEFARARPEGRGKPFEAYERDVPFPGLDSGEKSNGKA
jgi:hypothetical protein